MRRARQPAALKIARYFASLTMWVLAGGVIFCGCGTLVQPPSYYAPVRARPPVPAGPSHIATASWYGPGFDGRRTSSGEVFDEHHLTAASKTLPLGSRVRVTNLSTGRSVVVRVNDRGPFVRGRSLDLSHAAARRIGLDHEGVARVEVARLDESPGRIEPVSASVPAYAGAHERVWSEPAPSRSIWRVKVTRSRSYRLRGRRYRANIVADPIGSWILSAMPQF